MGKEIKKIVQDNAPELLIKVWAYLKKNTKSSQEMSRLSRKAEKRKGRSRRPETALPGYRADTGGKMPDSSGQDCYTPEKPAVNNVVRPNGKGVGAADGHLLFWKNEAGTQ